MAGAGRIGLRSTQTPCLACRAVDSVVVADANRELARTWGERLGIGYSRAAGRSLYRGHRRSGDRRGDRRAREPHRRRRRSGYSRVLWRAAAPDAASTRAVIANVSGSKRARVHRVSAPVRCWIHRPRGRAVLSGRLGWGAHGARLYVGPGAAGGLHRGVGGFFRDCCVHDFDATADHGSGGHRGVRAGRSPR